MTVEGVVSRVNSTTTYFQDGTAGLQIRYNTDSKGFHSAIASNDLRIGTQIRITGILSDFNGLLQINSDPVFGDHTISHVIDWEILGQGPAPEPQLVTLAEIAGDSHQAQLVHVQGLWFESAAGAFAMNATYQVQDASIAPATFAFRVGAFWNEHAFESQLFGTPIPEGLFDFTGVVGHFHSPQLMPVLLDDLTAAPAFEQVTIRQLTAVPQANLDQLNALGAGATPEQIRGLLTNEYESPDGNLCFSASPPAACRLLQVTGVVLSDPRSSGLASWNASLGMPGRIHVYIRDVAAELEGPEGMTIQVVDETAFTGGASLPLRPGDVVELTGYLVIFTGAGASPERNWQLIPRDADAITVIGTADLGASWLQPVAVTTADINMAVGGGHVQANWSNWNSLNSQFVRVENAVMTNRTDAPTGRPSWAFASSGHGERVAHRDVSLRYRNDRHGSYQEPFFVRAPDDPFVPPALGEVVDVEGFLAFGVFDAFGIGQPPRAKFFIAPMGDQDMAPPPPPGETGAIVGVVAVGGAGLGGVPVTLSGGGLAAPVSTETAGDGSYSFTDLTPGIYELSIAEPMGYSVDENPQIIEVDSGVTSTPSFALSESVLSNEARSMGYWKHQFKVAVTGNGNAHESPAALAGYIERIHQHYTVHFDHYEGLTTPAEWLDVLSATGSSGMHARALQHTAALLFNLVSDKIGQYMVVTEDDHTVGDALVTVSEFLAGDLHHEHELAKDIAEMINNKVLIPAGYVFTGGILFRGIDDELVTGLRAAFPNPSAATATIGFALAEPGWVRLNVYDVLGRKVMQLVDDSLDAGLHQITVDVSSLPSGTYIYRMEADGLRETRRFMVVR